MYCPHAGPPVLYITCGLGNPKLVVVAGATVVVAGEVVVAGGNRIDNTVFLTVLQYVVNALFGIEYGVYEGPMINA